MVLNERVYDKKVAFILQVYSNVQLSSTEWLSSPDPLVSLRLDSIVCACVCEFDREREREAPLWRNESGVACLQPCPSPWQQSGSHPSHPS